MGAASSEALRAAAGELVESSRLVAAPDDPRPGAWVGAPSAALPDDGSWWLAYRVRRPIGSGRGVANVVARSADGVHFEPVLTLGKDRFGAVDSLERPALVALPGGGWRLYVSCARAGTGGWWVALLEAATVEGLADAEPEVALPGSAGAAVKDPVVRRIGDRWLLWASVHPLDDPDATDRMTTEHAISADGRRWTWQGTALAGTPGSWDARGARITTVVLDGERSWATYDGRASAAENFEERTGLALAAGATVGGAPARFTAADGGPLLVSPHALGGLRYADAVPLPDGALRWFFECARPDGAHDLRTVLVPAA